MFSSILFAGLSGLALLSSSAMSADASATGCVDLEPAINGSVSADGRFPTQAMEEAFTTYLGWVKEQGISRLAAFESLLEQGASAKGSLPTESMQEQFAAYLRWADDQGLSPFYAFAVTDFD
jgi:hypothetical protein